MKNSRAAKRIEAKIIKPSCQPVSCRLRGILEASGSGGDNREGIRGRGSLGGLSGAEGGAFGFGKMIPCPMIDSRLWKLTTAPKGPLQVIVTLMPRDPNHSKVEKKMSPGERPLVLARGSTRRSRSTSEPWRVAVDIVSFEVISIWAAGLIGRSYERKERDRN